MTTSVHVEEHPALPALEELKRGKQWVCHDREKVPYIPETDRAGREALANDPTTWRSYRQAVRALQQFRETYSGIGREFVAEQGLIGIDLDHCIDEGGQIAAWALSIISRLNSYTEYSPSERGVHIWVRGVIPKNIPAEAVEAESAESPDGVEMYFHKRYFTVTGKHLAGTPTSIERRDEEALALFTEVTSARALRRQQRQARKRGPRTPKPPQPSAPALPDGDTPYGLAALRKECDLLGSIRQGGRNNQLNTSAYAMGQLVAGGELTQSTAEQELGAACDRNGLTHDEPTQTETTLKSGLEAGMQSPRKAPPKETRPALREVKSHPLGATDDSNEAQKPPPTNAQNGHTPKAYLPEVILGGQLHEDRDCALAALALAEHTHPTLFVQSARIVQVALDEKKRPIIMQVGVAEVRNALTRTANYYKIRGHGDEQVQIPVYPSKDIADAILSLAPSQWPFPPLEGIIETPVLRPDGTILDAPGYDTATRLYYIPQPGMKLPKVPAQPSAAERQQALDLLLDTIGEFPYADDADRANALALLMTPVVRPAIKRHIPLGLIDAPKQGAGKGLLADTVSVIATGKTANIFTAPQNEDEWSKSITALLLDNPSIIVIDNITGKLQSAALDGTLTADEKQGRILGFSRTINIPNRATWIATGNNIRLGGDLGRRSYRIRLDPHSSRPWMRTGFKHDDLVSWVLEHRGELIGAILTLARAWFVAGKPIAVSAPALGTFTNWSKTMGGILEYAGVPGFLANLEQLYQEADEDSVQWEAFLETWHEEMGGDWLKMAQLTRKMHTQNETETLLPATEEEEAAAEALARFAASLPEFLQEALKEKPKSFAIVLGRALEKRVDTCYGPRNLRLERMADTHSHQKLWRVVSGTAGKTLSLLAPQQQAEPEPIVAPVEVASEAPQAPTETPEAASGHPYYSQPTQPDHSAHNGHTSGYPQKNVPPSGGGRSGQENWEELEL